MLGVAFRNEFDEFIKYEITVTAAAGNAHMKLDKSSSSETGGTVPCVFLFQSPALCYLEFALYALIFQLTVTCGGDTVW